MPGMSPRIKAKKGRFTIGALPVITIDTPPTPHAVITLIPFNATATAIDAEDGDISSNITWSTDGDAEFSVTTGNVVNITTTATASQTITASITDSNGGTSIATLTVNTTAT